MIKVKKEDLKPGMILAEDVIGKNNIKIKRGTSLTERTINILKNNLLFSSSVVPVTKESYNSVLLLSSEEVETTKKVLTPNLVERLQIIKIDDENYKIEGNLENYFDEINIPGNLFVGGNIINCSFIYIAGTLSVLGDVENSHIVAKGDIMIHGDIKNRNKNFKINSFGVVTADNIYNATINANSVKVKYSIKNSDIIADTNIEGPVASHIQCSKLQAGYNIILGSVKQNSTLVIFSEKQMQVIKKLFEIEKRLKDFDKEIEPLKQSIRVFQILRSKINELPIEKRKILISNIKLFHQRIEKRKLLQKQFITLKTIASKIKEARESGPIVIEDEVEPGTKVVIDNSSFVVRMRDKGVVFYKKGMIIMGKKDKEWGVLI